jgi:hypothetical protein
MVVIASAESHDASGGTGGRTCFACWPLGAALTAALAFASAASTDKPVKEFAPAPNFTTRRFCVGFDVLVHITVNNEYAKTFSSGAIIVTGAGVQGRTDEPASGKTIAINISGPVFFSADGTSLVLKGNGLLFGEAGFFGPGSPPTLDLFSGQAAFTLDRQGNIIGQSRTGHFTNMCQVLA